MPQISQQMRQEAQPKSNPVGDILSMLLQTAQQQQSQMATVQGQISANQQRMGGGGGQPQKQQANAYQKGVDKALNESGYAHASEALMKGQDPMMIAQQSAKMGMQQSNSDMMPLLQNLLSMAQQPQQTAQQQYTPIQQQAMDQVSTPKSGIGKIFDALGFAEPVRQQKLNTLSKAQEIMGEQPVQEKDRYAKIMDFETSKINKMMDANKIDMNHATTYLDTIEKQPTFSGEELTKFTALDEMSKAGSKLLERMSKDPTALRTLGLPGDPYGQETLTWANQIAANRKFFQGGSALTPQENKTIESILAKRGLPAQFQDPEVARKIIEGIMDKAKTVFQKMDPYSEDREYITAARGKGYSDMDILKALRLYRTQRGK